MGLHTDRAARAARLAGRRAAARPEVMVPGPRAGRRASDRGAPHRTPGPSAGRGRAEVGRVRHNRGATDRLPGRKASDRIRIGARPNPEKAARLRADSVAPAHAIGDPDRAPGVVPSAARNAARTVPATKQARAIGPGPTGLTRIGPMGTGPDLQAQVHVSASVRALGPARVPRSAPARVPTSGRVSMSAHSQTIGRVSTSGRARTTVLALRPDRVPRFAPARVSTSGRAPHFSPGPVQVRVPREPDSALGPRRLTRSPDRMKTTATRALSNPSRAETTGPTPSSSRRSQRFPWRRRTTLLPPHPEQ